jgi:hypothetical protein
MLMSRVSDEILLVVGCVSLYDISFDKSSSIVERGKGNKEAGKYGVF